MKFPVLSLLLVFLLFSCEREDLYQFMVDATFVPVEGITLNETSLSLYTSQSSQLLPIISPSNATNKSVIWISDDPGIATVNSNGVVTGVSAGSVIITAETVDGAFTAICDVTVATDTDPPVPGGSGIIITGGITHSTLQLSWTPASDNVTPQNNLQYAVYQSNANNINSVANCESNGLLIKDYTVNMTSFNVTGLSSGSIYYFNVIVRDASGNKAVYNMINETTNSGAGLWIEQTGSGSRRWFSIASSADGNTVFAAAYGNYIFKSVDGGISWAQLTASGSRNWNAIASSSDGNYLFTVVSGGFAYTSHDGGSTWDQRDSSRWWSSVYMSSDGSVLFGTAESFGNTIHKSTDSGNSWVTEGITGADYLSHIKGSSDGAIMICSEYSNYVFISTNYGVDWTLQAPIATGNWSLASSADGNTFLAAKRDEYIYITHDGGSTWNPATGAGMKSWTRSAMSADGTKMAVIVHGGYIYTSADAGATWTEHTAAGIRSWYSVEISGDGTKIFAGVDNGYIYTYEFP